MAGRPRWLPRPDSPARLLQAAGLPCRIGLSQASRTGHLRQTGGEHGHGPA